MYFFLVNNIYLLVSDYVVVGSDSGRIVILEYIASKNNFERVNMTGLLLP